MPNHTTNNTKLEWIGLQSFTSSVIFTWPLDNWLVLLLSHVPTLWSHGLQHTRLPCPSYLLEFTQTHVHWLSDAIQPSHPLLPPFSSALDLPLHQGLFQWVSSLHQEVLSIRASASASASSLPMNIQGWLPSGLTGFISLQSKGLSRAFSSTTVRNYQFFGISLLYHSTLTSIHDDWKNHSFDSMDICWQKWCLCFLIWSLGMS